MIFIYFGTEGAVADEKAGIGILHHEVETLLGIGGVEGLIGCSCLNDAK